jgi:hypothetical protein
MNEGQGRAGGEHQQGEIMKASNIGADQIEVGLEVLGSDGQSVGKVKTVRQTDFVLDRPMARDLYVPFSAVRSVEAYGERPTRAAEVVLNVSAAHLETQGWPHT